MAWLPEQDEVKNPVTGADLVDDEEVVEEEETEDTSTENTSEEETAEEEVDEEEDELSDIKSQLKQTQKLLARVMATQTQNVQDNTEEKFEVPEFNFVQDVDMDELMTNPKLLNTMLNQAAKHGAQFAYEQSLKVAPTKITPVVQKKVSEAQKVESFFSKNADIAQFRPYFTTVAQDVFNEDPTMSVDKLLNETAKRVRKDLNLTTRAVKKRKNTGAVPPTRSSNFQKKKDSPLTESQKALEYIRKKRGEIQYPQKKKG